MHDKLENKAPVETIRPKKDPKDWGADMLKGRQWGVSGKIVEFNAAFGGCYHVEHLDGTKAWYERRELERREPGLKYSPEERAEMLKKMQALSDLFYSQATQTGCHAFIEFAGLMNEFIRVCEEAHAKGLDFPFANTHSGTPLPFAPHNLSYLGEKLGCIYGPGLFASEANRDAFIGVIFDGEYKLVPSNREQRVFGKEWESGV
jgi:hypothetical protein